MEPTQEYKEVRQAAKVEALSREDDRPEQRTLLSGLGKIRNLATITLCQRTNREHSDSLPLLLGTYSCNLDNKGRLIIPKAHLQILGSEKTLLAIADTESGSVCVFPKAEFLAMIPAAFSTAPHHTAHLEQVRISLQNAAELQIDKQHRIQLNPLLRLLGKATCSTCSVMGSGNFLEIKPQNEQ